MSSGACERVVVGGTAGGLSVAVSSLRSGTGMVASSSGSPAATVVFLATGITGEARYDAMAIGVDGDRHRDR